MSIDSDVIRGHVDTIILKTLTTGDKYGYEIIKEIEQKSQGTYELKQPTLYSCLKRLESQGLISAFWKNSDIGGKRHYYKLTKKGRESYENSMQQWFDSRSIIDSLMGTKPVDLVENSETNLAQAPQPEQVEEQLHPAPEPVEEPLQIEDQKQGAQMVLDESSNITQEAEPRDFDIENMDEDDAALLGDYYKTDENQINLFEAEPTEPADNDFSSEPTTVNEADIPATQEDQHNDETEGLKNFGGADLSKYRQSSKDNYFEQISYGVVDENNINIELPVEEDEDEQPETDAAPAPSIDFSTFNFFSNYKEPEDDDADEQSDYDSLTNLEEDEEANSLITTFDEDEENPSKLHFGFSDSDDEDMGMPQSFGNMSDLDEDEPITVSDIHPAISIYGEDDEAGSTDDLEPMDAGHSYHQNNFTPESSDLKPFNIGNYTEPEYKEKLNQLSSYAKTNYDTKPINLDLQEDFSTEPRSIGELKEDFGGLGIEVRTYAKPEKEPLKDRKYLLVNKIKCATSWIVLGIMTLLLGITYLVASKVGYTDLSMTSASLSAPVFFLFAWLVVLVVPATYTVIYLMNKTKKIKPNYNGLISLVFALLFFIVCLNIVYTLNILNGFTKFDQMDYNHLLWLLPAVDSLLIVFQSLVYSFLFKTRRFSA